MTVPISYPHPLVTSSVLYARDVPVRVKWDHLVATLRPCGRVAQLEVTRTKGASKKSSSRTWAVAFEDIAHAELALATLRGAPIAGLPGAPCPLALFASAHASHRDEPSASWALPQYVVGIGVHRLSQMNIFNLFSFFRRAGPLVSLRIDGDVGRGRDVCVVRYWMREHADAATRMITTALWDGCWYPAGTVSLKTYDPCTILVTNLQLDTTIEDIHTSFDEFGTIVEVRMVERPVTGDTVSSLITFATEDAAQLARTRMNLQMLRDRRIFANFVEYGSQSQPSPPSTHSSWREEPRKFTKAEFAQDDGRARKEEAAKAKVAEAEAAEAAAIAETAAATKAQTCAEDILERAAVLNDQREEELVASEAKRLAASEALRKAERAVEEGQRAARAARVHADLMDEGFRSATLRAELARSALEGAYANLLSAGTRVGRAKTSEEAARLRAKAARDAADTFSGAGEGGEAAKDEMRDELQESIHRMQELRMQEEEDKRQREGTGPDEEGHGSHRPRAEEQKGQDGRHTKVSATNAEEVRRQQEQERQAAEQRQKEDAARREAEAAQKAYDDAVRVEVARCRRRDDDICSGVRSRWPVSFALQRFELVSGEFDAIQFSERQPLTVGSVPWPTLLGPYELDVAAITWDMVDAFFEEARFMLAADKYRALVEKTHRRFHPDKWRSRRLLLSVRDEDLGKKLETAGNIVAQAMTPLWRRTKDLLQAEESRW